MGIHENGIFNFRYQFIRFVKNVVIDRFDKKGFVLFIFVCLFYKFFIFLIKKLMLDKIFK